MKLIVIDNGFCTDQGHHYAMNEFISHQAKEHQYKSIVIGPKDYDIGMQKGMFRKPSFLFRPVLSDSGYAYAIDHRNASRDWFLLKMAQFVNNNMNIASELQQVIPIHKLSDGDMILVHTAFLPSILGIANWLKTTRLPKIQVRLVFRFPPWFYQVHKELSELLFQEALSVWEEVSADVIWFTDVEEYSTYIRNRTHLPVYTTPIFTGAASHSALGARLSFVAIAAATCTSLLT